MDKKTLDLLIAFTDIKGSIRLQIPPSIIPDLVYDENSLLIEKLDRKFDVFQKVFPFTFVE